ncbi:hypothetical protein [Anaeroselena agilis]|uniref:Uncharacterized protein n=1 Tax=Anaeroselena agilis TaxID=3063788 RepID=A0ABU3NYJ6_9FIRM|nr:hypothetical protein [Selenomonadales bacterium 4137-cl]
MSKVIDLTAWLANSHMIDGRRRQISARTIRIVKTKQLLTGGRPGGDCA